MKSHYYHLNSELDQFQHLFYVFFNLVFRICKNNVHFESKNLKLPILVFVSFALISTIVELALHEERFTPPAFISGSSCCFKCCGLLAALTEFAACIFVLTRPGVPVLAGVFTLVEGLNAGVPFDKTTTKKFTSKS